MDRQKDNHYTGSSIPKVGLFFNQRINQTFNSQIDDCIKDASAVYPQIEKTSITDILPLTRKLPGSNSTRPVFINQEAYYKPLPLNRPINHQLLAANPRTNLYSKRDTESSLDKLSALLDTPRSKRPIFVSDSAITSHSSRSIVTSLVSVEELPTSQDHSQFGHLDGKSVGDIEIKKTLSNWRIVLKKTKSKFRNLEKWIIIQGLSTNNSGEFDIFNTTFIDERLNSNLVKSSTGSIYYLKGEMDLEYMMNKGFSDELVLNFNNGFPLDWEAIVHKEIDLIGSKVKDTSDFSNQSKSISQGNTELSKQKDIKSIKPVHEKQVETTAPKAFKPHFEHGHLTFKEGNDPANSVHVLPFEKNKSSDTPTMPKLRRISRELKDLVESSKEFLKNEPMGRRAASLKKVEIPKYDFLDYSQGNEDSTDTLVAADTVIATPILAAKPAIDTVRDPKPLKQPLLEIKQTQLESLPLPPSLPQPGLSLTLNPSRTSETTSLSNIFDVNTPKSASKSNIITYRKRGINTDGKKATQLFTSKDGIKPNAYLETQNLQITINPKKIKKNSNTNEHILALIPSKKSKIISKHILETGKSDNESKITPISKASKSEGKGDSKDKSNGLITSNKGEKKTTPRSQSVKAKKQPQTPCTTRSGRRVRSPGNWWEFESRMKSKSLESKTTPIKFIWGKVDVMVKQSDGKMAKMSSLPNE